jgi:8-oxo-dGTP diphosphatase
LLYYEYSDATRRYHIASSREYPERPLVGIGGVVIHDGRAVLIRRGSEPLKGEWSIPGGMLELGETLEQGVERELWEEVGLRAQVVGFIEVFDRIYFEPNEPEGNRGGPRFHYVIVDFLCELLSGEAKAGSDVTDVAWAREEELAGFQMTETAMRIVRKAFSLDRVRRSHPT